MPRDERTEVRMAQQTSIDPPVGLAPGQPEQQRQEHERRQGEPAMIVRLALVLVAIRATVGLSSGSR